MDNFYYFSSIRSTYAQFLDLFNGMTIWKYNSEGNPESEYEIPLITVAKEKFYTWMRRKVQKQLPIMSSQISSFDYNDTRQTNQHEKIHRPIMKDCSSGEVDQDRFYSLFSPVPYDLTCQLNIASLYMIEADQILEQILPFFDPFVMIYVKLPDIDLGFDVKILLEGVSPDLAPDMSDEEYRGVMWTLDFRIETYLFKPVSTETFIKKINFPIYNTNKQFVEQTETLKLDGGESPDKLEKYYTGGNSQLKPSEILSLCSEKIDLDKKLFNYETYIAKIDK